MDGNVIYEKTNMLRAGIFCRQWKFDLTCRMIFENPILSGLMEEYISLNSSISEFDLDSVYCVFYYDHLFFLKWLSGYASSLTLIWVRFPWICPYATNGPYPLSKYHWLPTWNLMSNWSEVEGLAIDTSLQS